jgi:hypothetical protein
LAQAKASSGCAKQHPDSDYAGYFLHLSHGVMWQWVAEEPLSGKWVNDKQGFQGRDDETVPSGPVSRDDILQVTISPRLGRVVLSLLVLVYAVDSI